MDVLLANAQNSVHICCESIYIRILGSSDKNKKQAINPNLYVLSGVLVDQLLTIPSSDSTLFKFLEQYLQRLEGPLASQVWGRFNQLVKDILAGSRDFKLYHFAALRSISALCILLSFIENEQVFRRVGREDHPEHCNRRPKDQEGTPGMAPNHPVNLIYLDHPQDHFGKLLDSCVVYVGRSTDHGSWIRRTAKDTILSTGSGRESPAPRSGKWPRI